MPNLHADCLRLWLRRDPKRGFYRPSLEGSAPSVCIVGVRKANETCTSFHGIIAEPNDPFGDDLIFSEGSHLRSEIAEYALRVLKSRDLLVRQFYLMTHTAHGTAIVRNLFPSRRHVRKLSQPPDHFTAQIKESPHRLPDEA
jgi:hypothetical protein